MNRGSSHGRRPLTRTFPVNAARTLPIRWNSTRLNATGSKESRTSAFPGGSTRW